MVAALWGRGYGTMRAWLRHYGGVVTALWGRGYGTMGACLQHYGGVVTACAEHSVTMVTVFRTVPLSWLLYCGAGFTSGALLLLKI